MSTANQPPVIPSEVYEQCVQCGLCLARCPTYRETYQEEFGPRARVQLVQMAPAIGGNARDRYLDSCLRCRMCEIGCPTEVPYGRLIRDHILKERALSVDTWQARAAMTAARFSADPAVAATHRAVRATLLASTGGARAAILAGPFWGEAEDRLLTLAATVCPDLAGDPMDRDITPSLLLDRGMWDPFVDACDRLEERIATNAATRLMVLDPHVAMFAGDYAKWRGRSLVSTPLESPLDILARSAARPLFAENVVLDVTPATVRWLDPFLRWLGGFELRPRVLPEAHWGAGAMPTDEPAALEFLLRFHERKAAWLDAEQLRLVTLDPLTLVRFGHAVHLFDCLTTS